jgi:calcineurin-like phosphoesterase family protein
MNRLLKLTQSADRKVYVTSDTHWNHNPKWPVPLWRSRGYGSVNESNEHQRDTINSIVRPNDILFHLGDVTLNCNEEQFESFFASLNCQTIYTLWGNHNSPSWSVYQREVANFFRSMDDDFTATQPKPDVEVYPLRYKNLIFIGNYAEVVVDGMYFVMAHYPIYVFNHMNKGAIHLCGHSHYSLPLSQADNPTSKVLDVGWDGWAKPLSVKEIADIMAKKQVMKVDHHGED